MWIKNTNGKKDAMLTFATFSFLVVTLNVFLSTFETISYGDTTVVFKALDTSVMAMYLGSTFTAYVSRRWTDKKYSIEPQSPVDMIRDVASQVLGGITSPAANTPQQEVSAQESPAADALPSQHDPADPNSTQPIRRRKPKKDGE